MAFTPRELKLNEAEVSAYREYRRTTSDNPIKSEEEWSEHRTQSLVEMSVGSPNVNPISSRAANLSFSSNQPAISSALMSQHSLGPIVISETDYNELVEYENRLYIVPGLGTYFSGSVIYREPWHYAPSDMHVMKSGNDDTGDGSFGNPYLTILKGFNAALSADGGKVWVHEGVYEETDGSNGYFLKSGCNPAGMIEICGRPDQRVVMMNESGSYVLRLNGNNSNIVFKNLIFDSSSTILYYVYIRSNATGNNNVGLIECEIHDTNSASYGFYLGGTDGMNTNMFVLRCTFTNDGSGNLSGYLDYQDGFRAVGNRWLIDDSSPTLALRMLDNCQGTWNVNSNTFHGGDVNSYLFRQTEGPNVGVTDVTLSSNHIVSLGNGGHAKGGTSAIPVNYYVLNNYMDVGGFGFYLVGGSSAGLVDGNRIISPSAAPLAFPGDGPPTDYVNTAVITNNHITATGTSSHGILIGANSSTHKLIGNQVDSSAGGSYGIVLKGESHTLTNNEFIGGNNSALYLKGCSQCNITGNVVRQTVPSSNGTINIQDGIRDQTTDDNTISGNIFYVEGAEMFGIGAFNIGPNNIVNDNAYILDETATWGNIIGYSVNSLQEVRSVWQDQYGQPNDVDSTDK